MKLGGNERRRSDRTPHIIESWLVAEYGDGQRIEVVSVNLSKHGVGFEMPQAMEVGQIFTIEIGIGEQKLVSQVRIANCRPIGNGFFQIGADFA